MLGTTPVREFHPAIARIDSLGNVQDLRYYDLDATGCQNDAGDLSLTANKGVITWGREWSFFALRADSNLAHVWSKHFDRIGGFQFIKELPGGDLIAGINMDTAGAVVARMDAAGNFIWCKSYIRPKGMVHDCLVESDSSFIITGTTDSTFAFPLPLGYHPKLFMMKLDGEGGVQWCKGYDNPALWYARRGSRIVRANDGNYVVLATYAVGIRPFFMKTDQNGDTLWTRSIAGFGGYAFLPRDLINCMDGSWLINVSGLGLDLYKTDPLGHLPCSDEPPHPLTVSDLFPVDSSFTLRAGDGAIAMVATVGDTTYTQYPRGELCLWVGQPPAPEVRKFNVRPNPSTGHFTVEFKDPLMAESYYAVYDAMGRLLYQRPLPIGATMEEVDLSRFGKGTYVIKLTDPEGVRYERVVLE